MNGIFRNGKFNAASLSRRSFIASTVAGGAALALSGRTSLIGSPSTRSPRLTAASRRAVSKANSSCVPTCRHVNRVPPRREAITDYNEASHPARYEATGLMLL